jgi:uncharacterized repeat protein (TIGR01451 family)
MTGSLTGVANAAPVTHLTTQTATATGDGAAGTPSIATFNIPSGKNRVLFIWATFERDHCSNADVTANRCVNGNTAGTGLGDNYPEPRVGTAPATTSNNQLTARVVGPGGTINKQNALVIGGTPSGDTRFINISASPQGSPAGTAYISVSSFHIVLFENEINTLLGGAPSGTVSITLPDTSAPSNPGDDAMLLASVFQNVEQTVNGFVRNATATVQVSAGTPGNSSLAPAAYDAGQAPDEADDGKLVMGTNSSTEGFLTPTGHTALATLSVTNSGGNYDTPSGNANNEPNGLTGGAYFRNGGATPGSLYTLQMGGAASTLVYGATNASFLLESDSSDAGDAPLIYGNPTHTIVNGLRLGANVDADTGFLNSSNATGDDTNGTDDEDGVTIPTLTQSQSATISVNVNQVTAGTGRLQGWIDWNGDGDFADAGEQIATNLQLSAGTSGTISVPVTVPAGAITSAPTFARFRWSTTADLSPTLTATNGEVEDYQVSIAAPAPLVCGTIFGSYTNGSIFNSLRSYNPSSGIVSPQIATLSTGTTNVDVAAIAVDPLLDNNGNRRVYYTDNTGTGARLFYYDGMSSVNTGITLTAPNPTINTVRSDGSTGFLFNLFNRMGFAPDGTLYILDSQKTFYRFSPDRSGTGGSVSGAITIADNPNNDIGNSGRAKVGQSAGGDIAFDNSGRMYIVTYDPNSSNIPTEFRLFQIINPLSSNPTAVLLGKEPSTDPVAGLAFQASDNTLYMQASGGKSFGWNLATNVITPLTTVTGSADLGSCTYPDLNPTGAFTKTVTNITNPGANVLSANDILEYTLDVTNNGNLAAGNTTLVDAIPAGTTYVAGSTKLNGVAQADDSGAMPYANTVNPKLVNSPGEASGILTVGPTSKATVVFRVQVNAAKTRVCNQSNVKYDGSLLQGIFSDNPTTTAVADDQTCTGVNQANVLLVKRITAIKAAGAATATNYNTFDTTSPLTGNDRHCNWPGSIGTAGACTNTYTVGALAPGKVKPGDEIEYTIYYLNAGSNKAAARICDRINPNLDFSLQGGNGIGLSKGGAAMSMLTNTGTDADNAQLTTAGLAIDCNLPNNSGTDVVVVDVGTSGTPLMGSTGAGIPTTSYGYIRIKTTVK